MILNHDNLGSVLSAVEFRGLAFRWHFIIFVYKFGKLVLKEEVNAKTFVTRFSVKSFSVTNWQQSMLWKLQKIPVSLSTVTVRRQLKNTISLTRGHCFLNQPESERKKHNVEMFYVMASRQSLWISNNVFFNYLRSFLINYSQSFGSIYLVLCWNKINLINRGNTYLKQSLKYPKIYDFIMTPKHDPATRKQKIAFMTMRSAIEISSTN